MPLLVERLTGRPVSHLLSLLSPPAPRLCSSFLTVRPNRWEGQGRVFALPGQADFHWAAKLAGAVAAVPCEGTRFQGGRLLDFVFTISLVLLSERICWGEASPRSF